MMIDAGLTIARGIDHLAEGDVESARADYELVRETYPVDSEWMIHPRMRNDLHELRDGIRNARKLPAPV